MRNLIGWLLFVCIFNANAEVIDSDKNGFSIKIETHVKADAATSYQQFLRIGEWWNSDHTWFGKSENLRITPRAGECFCETSGDKEVLHMTVSFVNPNVEIRMIGGLGPLQMMGVHGGMSWKFEEIGPTETKIIHQYQVTGFATDGLDKLAPIVDSVQTIQVKALAAKIESRF